MAKSTGKRKRVLTVTQKKVLVSLGSTPKKLGDIIHKSGDMYPDQKLRALLERGLVRNQDIIDDTERHKMRTWVGWRLTEKGLVEKKKVLSEMSQVEQSEDLDKSGCKA